MFLSFQFRRSLRHLTCQLLCALFLLGALAPAAYAGGGKKYFKEGLKYEVSKEWDHAAEQFSLALREDPGNAEYELHYYRALQNASLMFMNRGRLLADQQDYEGAYLAYKQAASFDPTNEQAVKRMKDMLVKQGVPSTEKGEPDSNYQATAAKNKLAAERASVKPRTLRSYDIPNESIENIIRLIARQDLRFNVIFDQQSRSMVQGKQRFDLKDIPAADALEILLDANNLTYFPVGYRTLMIGPRNNPTLQQKYDENLVQTFYIKNAKLEEVRSLIQNTLGQNKTGSPNTQLNTLTIRDTADNLRVIQKLIATIDKPQAEVAMDVNIYEVSQDDLLQIGNQFLTSPTNNRQASLSTLGGIGQNLREAPAGLFGNIGLSLVLPPSTLSFLQSRGRTKLLATTRLHSFEGEQASVNVGQSVPIQTASIPTFNNNTTNNGTNNNNNNNNNSNLFGGINQVQYRDVGLNISLKPKVIDDLVQMNLEIESSNVAAAANTGQELTPTFTQRKMKGVARVRDGQTTIAASVMSQNNTNSRKGIPVLSLLPGIGNLFSTPNINKQATHIVITVTPYILRGGGITEEEENATFGPLNYIIGPNGAASYGRQLTLQEIVDRADQKEQQEAEQAVDNQTTPNGQSSPSQFVPAKGNGVPLTTSPVGTGDGIVRPANTPQSNSGGAPVGRFNPTGTPGISSNGQLSSINPDAANLNNPTPGNPNATATTQNPAATQPIPLTVTISNPRPQVSQVVQVGVILSGYSTKISAASFYLHYNPSVLKVISIRDAGLMQPGGFNQRDDGGQVFVGATINPSTGTVVAAGQVASIEFQVIGPGNGDIRMDVVDIRDHAQQIIPVAITPNQGVTVGGNN